MNEINPKIHYDDSDIEVQRLNIVQLATQALEKPEDFGWWGNDEMFDTWGWAGIDKNNSSDAVEIVNFDHITKDLINQFPEDFEIVGLSHWVVGHVDRLTCRILKDSKKDIDSSNITDAFKAAMRYLMRLEDYPVIDDDELSEYCFNEIVEWVDQELPAEVYIRTSKSETVNQIIDEMIGNDNFEPTDWVLSGKYPTEEMIRYVAYDLSLCASEHREFWDEWVEELGLPPIYWGDNFGAPANAIHKINGQLSLFEAEGNV